MYRDVAHELDEHDTAVGLILIGEALVTNCESAARRLRDPKTTDRWLVVNEAQAFGEVWRYLDRARRVLAQRGVNTAGYDSIRPDAKHTVIGAKRDGQPLIDTEALDDARRAIEELKLVVPGADWAAIEKRTAGLIKIPLGGKQKRRAFVGTITAAMLLTGVAYVGAVAPAKKAEAAAKVTLKDDLADRANHRKARIDELHGMLGQSCIPSVAHEYAEALVMDGRTTDMRAFGADYVNRCGNDPVIEKWTKAPKPWHHKK